MTTTATVPPIETAAPGLVTRVPEGALATGQKAFLGAGVVALGASLIGLFLGPESREQFFFSYLVAYMFTLSIALGAMFFVLVQHLTRAGWSVVVRRVAENMMGTMPWLAVLFLPVVLGYHTLYHHWVDAQITPGQPGYDAVLAGKSGYLNVPFFFGRAIAYFVIWVFIATWFRRKSIEQDRTGDPALTLKMARVAAPCMFLFALSLTFAAIDWMMTLFPHWFSTIYGVCYFAGSFMAAMGVMALIFMALRRQGHLRDVVNTEHYHDMGKLLFAFMVFWTYVTFSQYMLIYYANLPEETVYFQARNHGDWPTIGRALIIGHFLLPFVYLMSRHMKRNRLTLALGAVFMLVMHWIDLYWQVMPALHHEGVHLTWLDAATIVGLPCVFLSLVIAGMRRVPLIPERDPRLRESLAFINH
jgi:hypothetical protein